MNASGIVVGLDLAVVGFVMSIATMNTAVRYTVTFLEATDAYSVASVILDWVSVTSPQAPERKAVAYSLVNVAANAAYIYCAYLWPKSDGPKSNIGFSTITFATASIVCIWVIRVWLVAQICKMRCTESGHQVAYAY